MGGYNPNPIDPSQPAATAREAAARAGADVGFRGSYGGQGGQAAQDYKVVQQWDQDRAQQVKAQQLIQDRQRQGQQGMKYMEWEKDQQFSNQQARTYAEQAQMDARNRPGYSSSLGDTQTEATMAGYRAANDALVRSGMPGINLDLIQGVKLESQRQTAIGTPGTRDDLFFQNELQKWGKNPIETEAAYQNLSRKADVPIPRSPFEFQSDMARAFLMGSESQSPAYGIMGKYLPAGQGVQQDSWDRAVQTYRGENNTDRPAMKFMGWEGIQPAPVSFMQGVAVLGTSSGSLWDAKIGTTGQGSGQGNPMVPARMADGLPAPFRSTANGYPRPFLSSSEPQPERDMFKGFASGFGFMGGNQTGADPFKNFAGDGANRTGLALTSWIRQDSPGMAALGGLRTDSPGMLFVTGAWINPKSPGMDFVNGARNQTAPRPAENPFGNTMNDKGTFDFLKKFAGVAGVTSAGYGSVSLPGAFGTSGMLASNPAGWGALGGGLIVFGLEATGNLGLWNEGRVKTAGRSYAEAWNTRSRSTDMTYKGLDSYFGNYVNRMSARLNESGSGMYGGSETPTKRPYRSELPTGRNDYSERPNYFPPVELPSQKRGIIEIFDGKQGNSNKNRTGIGYDFYDETGQGYPTGNPNRNPFGFPNDNPNKNPFIWDVPNKNPTKNPNENPLGNPYTFPGWNPNQNPNSNPYRFENGNNPGQPKFKIDIPNIPLIWDFGNSGSAAGGSGGKKRGRAFREIIPLDSMLFGKSGLTPRRSISTRKGRGLKLW